MNRILIFLAAVFIFSLSACKSKRNITHSVNTETETKHKVAVEEIDFNYFNSKAKVDYNNGSSTISFNVNIRMKKDSIVWLSVLAPLGIEAARALITPDSVHVLDRLNSRYEAYSIEWLKQNFSADLSFSNIQNMLLGNLVVPPYKETKLNDIEGSDCITLQQTSPNLTISNSISRQKKKVTSLSINEYSGNSLSVDYSEFGALGNYVFPYFNSINAVIQESGKSKSVSVRIKHNKPELTDGPLNFSFNVPSKFKKG